MSTYAVEAQRRFMIRAARKQVRQAALLLDRAMGECAIDTELVALRGELQELDDYMTQLARDDR